MSPVELHMFYEDLVCKLRDRGVVCGITSGLACVHYRVAETTKDCDLLCHPESFHKLLTLLNETVLPGRRCSYRGHISPPLDIHWHDGGWTSHFEWDTSPVTTLDVFGHAVRQSSPWEHDLSGLYAGMNVVAEMKRTARDKDWPFINLLGLNMIRTGDPRGWLHLFEPGAFAEAEEESAMPPDLISVRPVLKLAASHDPRLRPALLAERNFWQELDALRTRIYRAALRPFVLAMGRARLSPQLGLLEQHAERLACAERALKRSPILEHGIDRLIEEARNATAELVQPELLQWLPNVRSHFIYLA
jgi:hypothetical protein